PREMKEGLVVVDRQAVLGLELGAQTPGRRRMRTQQPNPGGQGMRSLCAQNLTSHVSSGRVVCDLKYIDSEGGCDEHFDTDTGSPPDRTLGRRSRSLVCRVRARLRDRHLSRYVRPLRG